MAATLDMTSFLPILKRWYTDMKVQNLAFTERPWLGMVPKDTNVRGSTHEVPMTYSDIGGISGTYASAKLAKSATNHKVFSIPMVAKYGMANIDGMTIRASANNRGAFFEAVTSEVDASFNALANDTALDLYGNGSGALARVAVISTLDITLASPSQTRGIEVGNSLISATTETGAVTAGTIVVTDIDRDRGIITIDADPGLTVGDYLFRLGDAANGGSLKKMVGLQGWLKDPATVTSTAFFGVDRTPDKQRLAGTYYNATLNSDNHEEALKRAAARVMAYGGKPDVCLMNPLDVVELDEILEGRGVFDKVASTSAEVGFDAIAINTPAGRVRVVMDPWCPLKKGFLLQKNTWKFCSMGAAPGFLSHDGNKFLRNSDADSIEVITGQYAQLACSAPGYNCLVQFT